MDRLFPFPKESGSWRDVLEDPLTRKLLGHGITQAEKVPFVSGVHSRSNFLLQDPLKHLAFAKIGYTALEAFLQANCTGPPLGFDTIPVIIPEIYHDEVYSIKEEMAKSLSVDGIDIYPFTPRIELFWLATCMLANRTLAEEGFNGRRARMRIKFWHQKLLLEHSDTLRNIIYSDAEILETQMSMRLIHGGAAAQEHMVAFLVERANIRIYYGDDTTGRDDLLRAAKLREFEFAITGAMGKKTKYQQKDTGQLVVLAKSRDHEPVPSNSRKSSRTDQGGSRKSSIAERSLKDASLRPATPGSPNAEIERMFSSTTVVTEVGQQPENFQLNDDTLLEKIHFNSIPPKHMSIAIDIVTETSHLPEALADMDPSDQPQLFPMDSIILLAVASSITNTQASDGLTREETLPYVTRVLEGGSSNWSVYTQALLVRSRIEGYRSRTTERGLLQLQAIVDQVIAETSGTEVASQTDGKADSSSGHVRSFLPKSGEGASVSERLRFVHQLQPPLRWELEAELAARWTQLGGLKTALEIYERLQMHTEAALCLAATNREAEAVVMLKKLTFIDLDHGGSHSDTSQLKEPLPAEAPRMLCILGDILSEPRYYNLAWTVSNERYARAQRSLGKFYLRQQSLPAAVEAYTAALRIARQDVTSWFSLGCVQLELENWTDAREAFTRVVQLEDNDAQGWSNLAVALLKLSSVVPSPVIVEEASAAGGWGLKTIEEGIAHNGTDTNDHDLNADNGEDLRKHIDSLQYTFEALRALRRAAQLKRDDARIWDNYLTVAASIPPNARNPERSTPWQEVMHAISHIVALRHKTEGESCIDLKIFEALVDHVTGTWDYPYAINVEADANTNATQPANGTDTPELTAFTNVSLPQPSKHQQEHADVSTRLPFLPRALMTLIDQQIAPLATSSPSLFLLLSRVSLWRHRPAESLGYIEKAWRATTNIPTSTAEDLVAVTRTLVNGYKELGPVEKERLSRGGEEKVLVEKAWRFKGRSAVRSVLGKLKAKIENGEIRGDSVRELEAMAEGLEKDRRQ